MREREREEERGGERRRECLPLLVHFSDACKVLSWARPKLRARNSIESG